MMKKGEEYKGFMVIDVVDVPDASSKGIYLIHKRTGMEIFHLLNDDEENLFAFAFRTPASDSSGVAHVLEHSVLCGSEHYPLRDVFTRLQNQNITTYLNAYTSSDRTVFPCSTTVKKEYFNLMSVYGDAVFFPLLTSEIFMQECHRLELDENGKPCRQGVVYNEMKGNYSSFDGVADSYIEKTLLEGTNYKLDSGGDPMDIPSLTVQKVRAFHKKHYCPANCMLFLYGNIPTEEQLLFIDKNFLQHFSSGGKKISLPKADFSTPVKPYVKEKGPASEQSRNDASVSVCAWRVGNGMDKENASVFPLEIMFLGDVLWGDDCAPVSKALLESKLGQDIAPQSGESLQSRYAIMSIGLRGVEQKDARQMQKLINETLKSICRNGIKKEDIDRTCMTFDFSNREIKRFQGPYSLVLLRRCLRGWTYGANPWETLLIRENFKGIKEKALTDSSYIPDLIEKYLLSNKNSSLIYVEPSISWSRQREKKEAALVRRDFSAVGKEAVLKALKKMHNAQNSPITEKENNLLPRVRLSDLSAKIEPITTKVTEVSGVPLFVNKEQTNGIVYADVAFPVDTLPAGEYKYLSVLASSCTQVGWGNLSWDNAVSLLQRTTGGFGSYLRTSSVPYCSQSLIKEKNYVGRDWLIFHFKVLEEQTEQAFNLLADCLTKTAFKDSRRLKDIVLADYNNLASSVVPNAHWYAMMRSCSLLNRSSAIQEIWDGLSGLFNLRDLSKQSAKSLGSHLLNLFLRIQKGGAVLHVTASASGISRVKKILPEFIKKTALTSPKKRYANKDSDFYALTELPCARNSAPLKKSSYAAVSSNYSDIDEVFVIPGTVGFAATSVQSSAFDTKECIADEVFMHCTENTDLWKRIRTVGGAYGVMVSTISDAGATRFMTYRDPHPFESLQAFRECLENSKEKVFSEDEVEKSITGTYSYEIEPRTPSGKGATGFLWGLYGLSNAQKARRVRRLLSITPKDIHNASVRYANTKKGGKTVVLCNESLLKSKNAENSGKIIKIPL